MSTPRDESTAVGVVVAAFIIATILGRWELVVIWPAQRHSSNAVTETSNRATSGAAS